MFYDKSAVVQCNRLIAVVLVLIESILKLTNRLVILTHFSIFGYPDENTLSRV